MDKEIIIKKIISELRQSFLNVNEDMLSEILSKYGEISDEELLKEIQTYNIDFEPEEVNEEDNFKLKFIDINNQFSIELKLISSFYKHEIYNQSLYKKEYYILLNKDNAEKIFYANTLIKFESEYLRNIEYGKLKKKLEKFNIIFK